jgi:hypothetical protein
LQTGHKKDSQSFALFALDGLFCLLKDIKDIKKVLVIFLMQGSQKRSRGE